MDWYLFGLVIFVAGVTIGLIVRFVSARRRGESVSGAARETATPVVEAMNAEARGHGAIISKAPTGLPSADF